MNLYIYIKRALLIFLLIPNYSHASIALLDPSFETPLIPDWTRSGPATRDGPEPP
jgi:hypothetical protein